MNLDEIYNQKHKQGIENIMSGNEFLDGNLNNDNDTRRGINLLIRPSEEVTKEIQNKIVEIKNIDPNLYLYSSDCLHFSLFCFVHQTKDFIYKTEQKKLYIELSKEILSNVKKFKISCNGLMLTDKGVLVKGFPDATMNEIRNKIRKILDEKNINHTEIYKDDICHLSLVRFKNKIENRKKLVEFINNNYNYDFGFFDVTEIELLYHDWYDTKRDVFEKFKLL